MTAYIAYPNGGMGHTIMAHSLYACRKLVFDLDNFFDKSGHAHKIEKFNYAELRCYHLEFGIKDNTIISVSCTGKYEILRKMMAYVKHHKQFPEPDTLEYFNFRGWQQALPLEFLSTAYFDFFNIPEIIVSARLTLDDYLHNRLEVLKSVMQHDLSWTWDDALSDRFYLAMIEANRLYIERTEYLEQLVEATKASQEIACDLKFWEKAAVISLVCRDLEIHPVKLLWDEFDFLGNSNQGLISALRKLNLI